jgi:hypothetical protein
MERIKKGIEGQVLSSRGTEEIMEKEYFVIYIYIYIYTYIYM